MSDALFAPDARSRLAAAYARPPSPVAAATAQDDAARPGLSAWERWEMDSLNAPARSKTQAASQRTPEPAPSPALLHAAELSKLRREAKAAGEAEGRREGHAKGMEQGRKEGHAEGLAVGLMAASAHAEQLRALCASLPAALRRADADLADAMLALAMDIARQVVHRTLQAEPQWVLTLVQELMQSEPALQGEPRLLLHPDDAALVRGSLGRELEAAGWQVRADESQSRGGCRVLTATGEVDATIDSRWQRVGAALRQRTDAEAGDTAQA
ncbi:flagellar assembly protein FliH [Variovorax dokdonensis]|uniref:Flagellar assembly protein FliH n=1 Tax=Variovorax dokdonensis TaxID=344883 RepID=A0ABT7N4U2_9BURK|nr:flagellar assembly protein FliH [Variovorax dokdonensis]MDM0042964.1 flagellar assembly protein FliH [Variovorax dokdonensis]